MYCSYLLLLAAILVADAAPGKGYTSENDILKFASNSTHRQYKIDESKKYRDCQERWEDGEFVPGVYSIYPNASHPVKVYCNHSVDATYTVIQRRVYGTESFYRDWNAYKYGFGNPLGDYWIGLDSIYHLTSQGVNLQIYMEDWSANPKSYTIYFTNFLVQSEALYYRMTYKAYTGYLQNDLQFNNGMYFYTPDRPDQGRCAVDQHCGWWFNYQHQCSYALLNGVYYPGGYYYPSGQYYDGIYYKDWHGFDYSLKTVVMSVYR